MSDELNRLLDEATVSRQVPGIVAGVFDSSGPIYEGAFGTRDLSDNTPMALDSVFSIMSMTKPIAGVACLQAVESGLLSLDQPAREVLDELAEVQVLEGFDADNVPVLRPPKTDVTLRNLLTHTSGFVYEVWNQNQAAYLVATGQEGVRSGTRDAYMRPLAFDPGTAWEYGIGIDWATMMLERVTGRSLGDVLRTEIFEPLEMSDTSFGRTASMKERAAPLHTRDQHGRFGPDTVHPLSPDRSFNGGGGGLNSTLHDYGRFVRMVLRGGELDGTRILSEASVDLSAQNHIGNLRVVPLRTTSPTVSVDAEFFPGVDKTWGLTFQINEQDTPTGRPAGSLSWAGLNNTYFWIDRHSDIAGVFLSQTLPFADPAVLGTFEEFERGVYAGRTV